MSDEWQDRLIYSEAQPVTDLLPLFHPDNPKIHPAGQTEALKGAIATLGWMARPKINVRSSEEWGEAQGVPVVIDGHDRIKAANESEQSELMCDFYDLSPNEERLFLLTYDPIGMMAQHDRTQVEALLHQVNTDDERLQQMLADFAQEQNLDWGQLAQPEGEADAEAQIDRADELQKEWQVEAGQMWRLPSRTPGQEHRIICGDCTDAGVVERVMMGEKAIVIFTDPPYGVSIGKKNRMLNSFQPSGRNLTSIASDDLSPIELKNALLPAFELAKTVMDNECSVFVTVPAKGDLGMVMATMMADAGLKVRHVLTWLKNAPTFSMNNLDYDYKHESILFTWGKSHRKNKRLGFGNSCWEIDKPRASADHPTMKPIELYEQAYKNHSDKGEVVYEMYCGSGTALIAAENLSRQCRAIEISPAYVAVCLQRYKDAFGIKAELVEG